MKCFSATNDGSSEEPKEKKVNHDRCVNVGQRNVDCWCRYSVVTQSVQILNMIFKFDIMIGYFNNKYF